MTNPYAPHPNAQPPAPPRPPATRPLSIRIISFVCGGITAFILLHLAFVLLQANQGNPLVSLISGVAGFFAWPFLGIFTMGNPDLQSILNYGLAAVAYMLIGGGLMTLFRRH